MTVCKKYDKTYTKGPGCYFYISRDITSEDFRQMRLDRKRTLKVWWKVYEKSIHNKIYRFYRV